MTSVSSQLVLAAAADETGTQTVHALFAAGIVAGLVGLLVLFVVVVISILKSELSTGMKLIWVLFVFWMPVLAWFAWYLIGRPDARRRPAY